MVRRVQVKNAVGALDLAVRIHDAAAGLGVGMGVLQPDPEVAPAVQMQRVDQALNILAQVLGELRQLSRDISGGSRWSQLPANMELSLRREAEALAMNIELDLAGELGWLGTSHLELIWLASREGLRNVRRHSGTRTCRINLNLASCPFVLRVRDWGGGLESGPRHGSGITLLRQLAELSGCDLKVGSQPGLGTELVLVGPACACGRHADAKTPPT